MLPAVPVEGEEEEVVQVTIDRRSKTIQQLSGSAEVFTQSDLERRNVTSVRELTAATPYVEIGTQEGNLEIYMRGVGNNNNTEIGDPAAASHIDGIYIPRPRGFGSMFFDIDRVEISRGPQGTLRGRNATAGTLNIVTAAPKLGEWGANASFQYGNYMQRLTKAMVNVPVGEKLALRAAVFSERREPFYKNEGGNPNIRAAEDADTFAYRVSAKYAPSNKVSMILRHDNTFERGTGWVGSNVTDALAQGILPEEIPDVRSVAYVGHQPHQSLDHWGVSLQMNFDLGPVQIELLNSYRNMLYTQNTGTTNGVNFRGKQPGNLDRYSDSFWRTSSESVVNELRFSSPDTSRFRWTIGGYNMYESQYAFLGTTNDKAWGWGGQEFNMPDMKDGGVAGFADATVDILDNLRALAGIRVTHDWKHRNGISFGFGDNCDQTKAQAAGLDCNHRMGTEGFRFAAQNRTDYTAGGMGEPANNDFFNGITSFGERDTFDDLLKSGAATLGNATEQHGSHRENFIDFRVGVEQTPSPNNLLYLTFSTGHKSGGFNDSLTAGEVSWAPEFSSEAVYATEIGSKNEFSKAFTLNAAAFWYAYQNYQTNVVREIPPPSGSNIMGATLPTSSVRENVGDARVLGLEIDMKAKLPYGLGSRISAALLDARFLGAENESDCTTPVTQPDGTTKPIARVQHVDGCISDARVSWNGTDQPYVALGGRFLPRAPQLAISYGLSQVIPTGIGYFDWSLSGQTKSRVYMLPYNGDGKDTRGNVNPVFSDVIPWTTRFDGSVGYARPQGDIRFDFVVANITGMTYMTSMINTPGLNLRFYNTPRQYGLRLTMDI